MEYFISDLHLEDEYIIKLFNRPFLNANEMDEKLIRNWNSVVNNDDKVYIIGDLFSEFSINIEKILPKLHGEKHLIIGNHDYSWINKIDLKKFFSSVSQILNIKINEKLVTLCHYPMFDFDGKVLICGHIHNGKKEIFPYTKQVLSYNNIYNAGVEINNYRPVTFQELVKNNQNFKKNYENVYEQQ